jgi:serine phosphatase RsbU (regulator of sigma subunit)
MADQQKKTLLLADDEQIICKPLSLFFERKGYFVLTAADGEEALQVLSSMKVDAMIADLRMPKLNGIELIEKALRINPDLAIVILSGAGSIDDARIALKTGAFDYVQKPVINMDELDRIVSRAIEHSDLERKQKILQKNLEEKTEKLEEKVRELNETKEQLEKQSEYLQKLFAVIEQQNIRMEEDLRSAQHIQEDLLPKDLPKGEHFSIMARYIPSGKVAGDMFDAFFDPVYNIHMYVADVAGHGVGAAMVTVFLKKTITPFQHFTDINTTPADILRLLNGELIKAGFGKKLFVTMLYATFSPPARKLTFASAGHTPLILKSRGREAQVIGADGISLGWKDNPAFREVTLTLNEGDRVLMYTDGLTNAVRKSAPAESCGMDSILRVVNDEKYHALPLGKLVGDVITRTQDSCEFKDDVCVLSLTL